MQPAGFEPEIPASEQPTPKTMHPLGLAFVYYFVDNKYS